jgi:hypothetical protein
MKLQNPHFKKGSPTEWDFHYELDDSKEEDLKATNGKKQEFYQNNSLKTKQIFNRVCSNTHSTLNSCSLQRQLPAHKTASILDK